MSANQQNQTNEISNDRLRLGQKLKEAREYLNLSQDEVARNVGIPRAAISLIETGQRRVDALELREFARAYKRTVGYFTEEEEVPGNALPVEVSYLARAFEELSERDRMELTRFAEFLQSRNETEDKK